MQASETPAQARLLCVVAVPFAQRVTCQQPGCGHSVYAAVHVVEENGQLLVLGSTCFAKRYGHGDALGQPFYPSAGGGRPLTPEERELLQNNTAALIARFEAEQQAAQAAESAARKAQQTAKAAKKAAFDAAVAARAQAMREQAGLLTLQTAAPGRPAHPWPWQHHSNTSVAVLRAPNGVFWLRVQHQDGTQRLVPWGDVPDWQQALPVECGKPDLATGSYVVPQIVVAISALRRMGFSQPEVTKWPEVLRSLPPLPR
jgi:hypothetical protein